MSLKSDIGARAAWKGFSSQTVYIAYRLMILEEKFDIYPESTEDLMIKEDNEIPRPFNPNNNFSFIICIDYFLVYIY